MEWEDYGLTSHSICVAKYENHPEHGGIRYYNKDSELIIRLYAGSGASLYGHNKFAKVKIMSNWRRGELHIWPGAYIEDDIADVEIISNNYRIPQGTIMTVGFHQMIGYEFSERSWNDLDNWFRSNIKKI